MPRPRFEDSERRKQAFKVLLIADLHTGGRKLAHKNVVKHAKDAGIDPARALKLSWDPAFIEEVHRFR